MSATRTEASPKPRMYHPALPTTDAAQMPSLRPEQTPSGTPTAIQTLQLLENAAPLCFHLGCCAVPE